MRHAPCPSGPTARSVCGLRLGKPTLEGAVGIVKYEEVGGTKCIETMRACVRKAITNAGGVAARGARWERRAA